MGDVNDKTERRTRDEAARDEAAVEGESSGQERAPARGTAEHRKGAAPKPGDAARKMRAMFKG